MKRMPTPIAAKRSGAILIYVLVCIGVGLSLMMTSLHSSLRQRRQYQQWARWEQAQWLLEAGYVRAVQQLERSADYGGETWAPAVTLATDEPVQIDITVRRSDDAAAAIQVTTQIGDPQRGEQERIRRQQTFVLAGDG